MIVPEGIIFQSSNAYKQLRKTLIEDGYLYAVVSLPAGVFHPYSGVKTSILLIDRRLAQRAKDILFLKIENDGFDLGAQRNPIDKSDLPEVLEIIRQYKIGLAKNESAQKKKENKLELLVPKAKIAESGDFNLNIDRYKQTSIYLHQKWPMVKLGDICELIGGGTPSRANKTYWENGSIRWISAKHIQEQKIVGYELITKEAVKKSSTNIIPDNEVIVVTRVSVGKIALTDNEYAINQDLTGLCSDPKKIISPFLYHLINYKIDYLMQNAQGLGVKGIRRDFLANITISLPPLEVQEQIVAEIEQYQKVIDGARQVVENWKPRIKIDPEWEMVKLGEVCEKITKGTTPTTKGFKFEEEGINFIKIESITNSGNFLKNKFAYINQECDESLNRSRIKEGDVLFSIAGALGRVALVTADILPANTNQALSIIRLEENSKISEKYLFYVLKSDLIQKSLINLKVGVAQYNLSLKQISELKIPHPPIQTQKEIIDQIEAERNVVEGSKKLIEIYDGKIKEKIADVWGEGKI